MRGWERESSWPSSRIWKFFMERGVIIGAELTSEHCKRSPIIQGGMEIHVK